MVSDPVLPKRGMPRLGTEAIMIGQFASPPKSIAETGVNTAEQGGVPPPTAKAGDCLDSVHRPSSIARGYLEVLHLCVYPAYILICTSIYWIPLGRTSVHASIPCGAGHRGPAGCGWYSVHPHASSLAIDRAESISQHLVGECA